MFVVSRAQLLSNYHGEDPDSEPEELEQKSPLFKYLINRQSHACTESDATLGAEVQVLNPLFPSAEAKIYRDNTCNRLRASLLDLTTLDAEDLESLSISELDLLLDAAKTDKVTLSLIKHFFEKLYEEEEGLTPSKLIEIEEQITKLRERLQTVKDLRIGTMEDVSKRMKSVLQKLQKHIIFSYSGKFTKPLYLKKVTVCYLLDVLSGAKLEKSSAKSIQAENSQLQIYDMVGITDRCATYAIKRFSKFKPITLTLINNEAKILGSLPSHPNVMNIALAKAKRLIIPGANGDLFEFLSKEKLSPSISFIECIKMLLNGLSHIHHHDVLHRDIKPENILFISSDSATIFKYCDFGAASFVGDDQDMVGTQGYMAIECVNNPTGNPFSKSSDIWSLGMTLWSSLTRTSFVNILYYLVMESEDIVEITMDQEKEMFQKMRLDEIKSQKSIDTIIDILGKNFSITWPGEDPISQEEINFIKQLLKKMIQVDPAKRISADKALEMLFEQQQIKPDEK